MKKHIAVLSVVAISLGFAAAGMASTVKYDYDRDVDFSKWRQAAWKASVGAAPSMASKRIAKALEAGFAAKGYPFVANPAEADFVVEYHIAAGQDVEIVESFHGPVLGRSVWVEREAMGSLAVRVYDRKTGKVAWHGVVTDALADDPDQADKKTAKAVEKLLKKFPARAGWKGGT
jgi:hypothetical protein